MCDHLALKWPDLVILDRDGVINHDSKAYIKSADEWMPIEGSLEAISKLSNAGVKIGIATNQRGISLGLYDLAALTEMHEKMYTLLAELNGEIHAVEFCTADDKAHPDRKPNPGMLLKIKDQLNMPEGSVIYFVGDKQSDIEAAINAGVLPILVRTGNGEKTERDLLDGKPAKPLATFDSLSDFIHALSASTNSNNLI